MNNSENNTGNLLITKKVQLHTNRSVLDLLFILILLFTFAVSALVIVMIGANVYKSVVDDMQSNYALRIPLSYISSKIKQHDQAEAVHLVLKEGTPVLVLDSTIDEVAYENWIYAYDHQLYEVLLEKGDTLVLSDGITIMPLVGLDFNMPSDGMLEIRSYDAAGESLDLTLSLRSSQ